MGIVIPIFNECIQTCQQVIQSVGNLPALNIATSSRPLLIGFVQTCFTSELDSLKETSLALVRVPEEELQEVGQTHVQVELEQ